MTNPTDPLANLSEEDRQKINELLARLTGTLNSLMDASYTPTPEEQGMAALRKKSRNDVFRASTAAYKKVGSQLAYASTPHVVTAFLSGAIDAVYTSYVPVEQALQHESVQSGLEEAFGTTSVSELIRTKLQKHNVGVSTEKHLTTMTHTCGAFKKSARGIYDRAQAQGVSVDDIVNSPTNMASVIVETYGSLENYKAEVLDPAKRTESIKSIKDMNAKLEQLPMAFLIQGVLDDKLGEYADAFNADQLASIAKSYANDLLIFAEAFVTELYRISEKNYKSYKKASAGQ